MAELLHILIIFGTRPEAIKFAPLVWAMRDHAQIHLTVCSTGQQRDLLDQTMKLLEIQVDYDLDLMTANQTLPSLFSRMMTRLDDVMGQVRPDWVLVQGDTTSAVVGALSAYYRRIPIGHVEAGLRTYDKYNPFPEEGNRRMIDVLADLYFAPTATSYDHLLQEGIGASQIENTGNTGIDALYKISQREFPHVNHALSEIPQADRLILVTSHRRENLGPSMRNIFMAVSQLAKKYPDVQFIVIQHPNPQTHIHNHLIDSLSNVKIMKSVDYAIMVHLLKRSTLVLTDSGGLQEEAPSLGIPVLVLRDHSERPEGIEAGVAKLVGTNTRQIVETTSELLDDQNAYRQMAKVTVLYGDGQATSKIINRLLLWPVKKIVNK